MLFKSSRSRKIASKTKRDDNSKLYTFLRLGFDRKQIPKIFNAIPIAATIETAYPSITNRKVERENNCETTEEFVTIVWLMFK